MEHHWPPPLQLMAATPSVTLLPCFVWRNSFVLLSLLRDVQNLVRPKQPWDFSPQRSLKVDIFYTKITSTRINRCISLFLFCFLRLGVHSCEISWNLESGVISATICLQCVTISNDPPLTGGAVMKPLHCTALLHDVKHATTVASSHALLPFVFDWVFMYRPHANPFLPTIPTKQAMVQTGVPRPCGIILVHLSSFKMEKSRVDNKLLLCFTDKTETQSGSAESGASFGCQMRHSVQKKKSWKKTCCWNSQLEESWPYFI